MSFVDILYTILIGPLQLVFEIIYTIANRFIGHPGLAIVALSLIMNFLVLPLYKRSDAMQEAARDIEEKLHDGVAHIKKTFTGDGKKLERLIKTLKKVPLYPAESFYEAYVASSALMFFSNSFEPGRLDDYLYPFYKKDTETGLLTSEQAKELLMCFWLKTCEGDESQNLTVGGNIENALTFLCLEVASELKVQQPSVSVRISEQSSDLLWKKTIELVKCKIGMPAIFNDKTVIQSLENVHVEKADATETTTARLLQSPHHNPPKKKNQMTLSPILNPYRLTDIIKTILH